MRIATGELKKRFDQISHTHSLRWEKGHPEPKFPDAEQILQEFRAGQGSLREDVLRAELEQWIDLRRINFANAISTPTLDIWRAKKQQHNQAREQFMEARDNARQKYQDRALFDGESGYLMLQDFENWREAKKDL